MWSAQSFRNWEINGQAVIDFELVWADGKINYHLLFLVFLAEGICRLLPNIDGQVKLKLFQEMIRIKKTIIFCFGLSFCLLHWLGLTLGLKLTVLT